MNQKLSGYIACRRLHDETKTLLETMAIDHAATGELISVDDTHVTKVMMQKLTQFIRDNKLRATLSWEDPTPNEPRRIIMARDGVAVAFEEIPVFVPIKGPEPDDDPSVYEDIVNQRHKMETDIIDNLYEAKLPRQAANDLSATIAE